MALEIKCGQESARTSARVRSRRRLRSRERSMAQVLICFDRADAKSMGCRMLKKK